MGSVFPSSRALCQRIVREAWPTPGKTVLILGAGTGVVPQAFLKARLAAERLVLMEIDPNMAAHLRARFPGVTVIEGDARILPDLLPERFRGRIGSVVCCIPLVMLPEAEQRRFIDAMSAVAPGRGFVHYSYCVTSPLPARRLGLKGARKAWTPLNLPPASVWRYSATLITGKKWIGAVAFANPPDRQVERGCLGFHPAAGFVRRGAQLGGGRPAGNPCIRIRGRSLADKRADEPAVTGFNPGQEIAIKDHDRGLW
jgi:phosphatidylethanolamine/phosphatidyl-N-methylethanolamine N-methyltransferase